MGLGKARGKRAMVGAMLGVGVAIGIIAACSEKKNNELMLALQTDLSIPKDVDLIRIEVVQGGVTLFQKDYPVGPDGAHIPATLGVVDDPNQPGQPVKIRIIARQKGTLRILRQTRTTIPPARVATLRMPIHWLCWNQVIDPGDGGDPQPTCPEGQSCINGVCADEQVDPTKLADFDPTSIFGGGHGNGDGVCLDTIACFSQGAMVPIQTSDCTIDKPASAGAGINVSMVRKPGVPGICSGVACYVPVDSDPDFGWTEVNGRIQLPAAVCLRLSLPPSDKLAIVGVATTTACSTKTSQIPTCGPWSSVAYDSGTFEAAAPAGFDAGTLDGSVTLPDGGACDPGTQWPKMLAAPIVPPSQIAGIDLANGGKGNLTIDQAEQINCAGNPATPITAGYEAIAWGTNGDVFVEYNPQTRIIHQVTVQKGYTGLLSYDGPQHHYDIGVGTLKQDSVAVTIDWANPNALVQQIYTAYMTAFYKTPGDADCFATGDCFANVNAQTNASGIGIGVHQSFPLYVVFAKSGSAPIELYTTWAPGALGAPGNDAGATTDAGGGQPDAAAPKDASAGG